MHSKAVETDHPQRDSLARPREGKVEMGIWVRISQHS